MNLHDIREARLSAIVNAIKQIVEGLDISSLPAPVDTKVYWSERVSEAEWVFDISGGEPEGGKVLIRFGQDALEIDDTVYVTDKDKRTFTGSLTDGRVMEAALDGFAEYMGNKELSCVMWHNWTPIRDVMQVAFEKMKVLADKLFVDAVRGEWVPQTVALPHIPKNCIRKAADDVDSVYVVTNGKRAFHCWLMAGKPTGERDVWSVAEEDMQNRQWVRVDGADYQSQRIVEGVTHWMLPKLPAAI